jgi:ribosomal protein S14
VISWFESLLSKFNMCRYVARANHDMFIHACDCSPTAIAALVANPEHDPRRCDAFVADLSSGDAPLRDRIQDDSVDAVTGGGGGVRFLCSSSVNLLHSLHHTPYTALHSITRYARHPSYTMHRSCKQRVSQYGEAALLFGVFFFSALDYAAFARVARECARVLRPGGVVGLLKLSSVDP